MFKEEIRQAIMAAPRLELPRLSAALWKAYAAGAVVEDDAQALAELIEARKTVPSTPSPRRQTGSRPRSPESLERRRRWTGSGWMPPQLAAKFTMGEAAVLAVVANQVVKHGRCTLTIGAVAAMAGVGKTTVRTALQEAITQGLVTVEEHRLTAFRNAPNTVRVVSREWSTWLRMAARRVSKGEGPNSRSARSTQDSKALCSLSKREIDMERGAASASGSQRPGSRAYGVCW